MSGAPFLECMEGVRSLISGSAFARLIQKGSFQFIKGRYFEDCWRDQQVFACRQNIPPKYLWTGGVCVKLWEAHGPCFMLSISYGWLHEDHPDPEMFHLKRLAKVVKAFKKFCSIDSEDCAVFLYFCSLWQKELVDGVDTRTPEQIVQFKEALGEIDTPYGHEAITSVRLEAVPEGTVRTYHMRGWTEFEKRIIDCKGTFNGLLRTTVVLPEGFDADCSDLDTVRRFHKVRGHETDFKGPPLNPSRFNEKLRQLHEVAQGNGVRLFTNGLEDMDLVRRKYADSYALLTQSTQFYYKARHWSSDDFECLVEALPDFTNLCKFKLSNFKLSTDQAQRLAVALSHSRACVEIDMSHNGLTLSGQWALFGQWRAKQSIWCCADCCLCGELCCCCGGLCCGGTSDGKFNCFFLVVSVFFPEQVCHERIREPVLD